MVHVRTHIRTNKRAWYIGVVTIVIVVTFACLLQSAVSVSPVIFMRLSEDQAGETDFLLTAESSADSFSPFLNHTRVCEGVRVWAEQGGGGGQGGSGSGAGVAGAGSPFAGAAPRWSLVGEVAPTPASGLPPASGAPRTSAYVLAIDSAEEARIGLGRMWGRRPLGPTECYASSSVLSELGVRGGVGERVTVTLSPAQIIQAIIAVSASNSEQVAPATDGRNGTTSSDTALIASLLAAAGIDLANIQLNVDAVTALRVALIAAGLAPDVVANVTAGIGTIPGVTFDLTPILAATLAAAANNLALQTPYTVVDAVPKPAGKYASLLGNVVVIEAKYLAVIVQTTIATTVENVARVLEPLRQDNAALAGGIQSLLDAVSALQAAIPSFNYDVMKQFALEVHVMLQEEPRKALYLQTTSNGLNSGVMVYANQLLGDILGPTYPISVATPLSAAIDGVSFIALFLQQVFTVTVVVLGALGSVVIYSLILGDVETRTYELGMLRALGMKHSSLSQLLAIQTSAFVVPGIAIGVILSSLLYVGLVLGMRWYAAITLRWSMPDSAWAFGIILGLVVPALAVIVPIRRALSSNLRDALDISHNVVNDVTVRVLRLASLGLSPTQTALAIMLVAIGFVTFYLLPLSFLFQDFAWFLGILTGILLAMLVGMTMLSQALQAPLERIVLGIIVFVTRDRALTTMVFKNLHGHRPRNSKTSYMIAITVGFLVFASAMFGLQASSIVTNVRLFLGADVVALTLGSLDAGGGSTPTNLAVLQLPQQAMTEYLTRAMATSNVVEDFTYVSTAITAQPFVRRTPLGNLVGIPRTNTRLYGVQRNFLDVAYREFTIVTEATAQGISRPVGVGGSLATWATNNPIEAMYAGAGTLRLPIEDTLSAPPQPAASGPVASPMYTCNVSLLNSLSAPYVSGNGSEVKWSSVWEWQPDFGYLSQLNGSVVWARAFANASIAGMSSSVASLLYARECGSAGGCFGGELDPDTSASPPWPFAYSKYDYCMAACTNAWAVQNYGNASWETLPEPSGDAPFYGSSAYNARLRPTLTNATRNWYVPSMLPFGAGFSATGPGRSGGFPLSCHETSFFSSQAQADRISGSYLRYVDVLMSEGLRGAASLSTATPLALRVQTRDPATTLSLTRAYLAKARAQLRKLPGFFFSSYSTTGSRSAVLMRMQDAERVLRDAQGDYAYILSFVNDGRRSASGSADSASGAPPPVNVSVPRAPLDAPLGPVPVLRAAWPAVPADFNFSGSWLFSATPRYALAAIRDAYEDSAADFALAPSANATTILETTGGLAQALVRAFPGKYAAAEITDLLRNATLAAAQRDSEIASTVHSAFVTADIGRCAYLSSVQLRMPGDSARLDAALANAASVHVEVLALTDAAARGFESVFAADFSPQVMQAKMKVPLGRVAQGGYSSRWWGMVVTVTANAAVTSMDIPFLPAVWELSGVADAACQADGIAIPDDVPRLPKQRLMIKLSSSASEEDRQRVINGLRSLLRSPLIQVQDTRSLLSSTDVAVVGLDIFFAFVAAIALILCFFAAWLSFTANVSDNSVEFGIMRSLGLTSAQVLRVFVYEAMAVIMTAFLLGTAVGLLVAITLTLQFNLFLEMPFDFRFPTVLFVLTFVGCLLLSLVASYFPARRLRSIAIASVLKGRTTVT